MELPSIAAAWLVLDGWSTELFLGLFALLFLGVPLLAGAVGAVIYSRNALPAWKGFVIATILVLLIVILAYFGIG